MAGSYNHIVTTDGHLISNDDFPEMIENLGDAYEAIEELYGMIWFLASMMPNPVSTVENARVNHKAGIGLAQYYNRRGF